MLVALIRPFPPRSRPKVTISSSSGLSLTFDARMAAAGATVLLPDEVSAFAAGKWQTTTSLSVAVKEADSEINGVVALNGLREGYHRCWQIAANRPNLAIRLKGLFRVGT